MAKIQHIRTTLDGHTVHSVEFDVDGVRHLVEPFVTYGRNGRDKKFFIGRHVENDFGGEFLNVGVVRYVDNETAAIEKFFARNS